MAGQAADAAPTFDDIADLINDNPGVDAGEERDAAGPAKRGQATGDTDEENPDLEEEEGAGTDEPEEPDELEEGEEGDEGDEADRQQSKLHEVTVKGPDGAETTEKVTLDELKNGYLRHADYTRSKQELSSQRADVLKVADTRVNEAREKSVNEIAFVHAAIQRLAAIPSAQELAHLAQTDINAYHEVKARSDYVQQVLSEIREHGSGLIEASKAEQEQAQKAAMADAWEVLQTKGVKAEEITPLFETIHKTYGVPRQRFQNLTDPALVLIMRDAAKFKALQTKTATPTKQQARVTTATPKPTPQLPSRQNVPAPTRQAKAVERKFRSGQATTRDLASYIQGTEKRRGR